MPSYLTWRQHCFCSIERDQRCKEQRLVQVKKWKLEKEDTTLLDLIPFLEAVCSARQMDVRDVVNSYEGQDIPTAFR